MLREIGQKKCAKHEDRLWDNVCWICDDIECQLFSAVTILFLKSFWKTNKSHVYFEVLC